MGMIHKKKFDIIVPCYNVDHIIEKSLGSIFSQDYSKDKFSVIAIDDGSTDSTLRCLNSFIFGFWGQILYFRVYLFRYS